MFNWLSHRAKATPDTLALIIKEKQWRYAELNQLVDDMCHYLMDQGVCSLDHVAVLMPNCLAYVCLIHAVARLGAVLVPLNTRLTESELAWQLEHVEANWLICDETTAEKGEKLNCQLLIVNSQWCKGQGAGGKGDQRSGQVTNDRAEKTRQISIRLDR